MPWSMVKWWINMRPAAGVIDKYHQANGGSPEYIEGVESWFQWQLFKTKCSKMNYFSAMENKTPQIHPSAIIDPGARIGNGTRIWHFVHIMPSVVIGENCVIGQNVFVDNGVIVGNGVKIQNNVSVYNGVTLEEDVFIGPSVVFTNVINPRAFIERKNEFKPTLVKKGASIGANATILCGVIIGEYALVAAGSMVTKDIAPYSIVMGNPATQQGWVSRVGGKLQFGPQNEAICPLSGEMYILKNNNIFPSK